MYVYVQLLSCKSSIPWQSTRSGCKCVLSFMSTFHNISEFMTLVGDFHCSPSFVVVLPAITTVVTIKYCHFLSHISTLQSRGSPLRYMMRKLQTVSSCSLSCMVRTWWTHIYPTFPTWNIWFHVVLAKLWCLRPISHMFDKGLAILASLFEFPVERPCYPEWQVIFIGTYVRVWSHLKMSVL